MKYDTIVFDLDGTLLNTIEDITDSVNDVLVSEGLVPITVDEARKMVGNGSSWLVKSCLLYTSIHLYSGAFQIKIAM